MKSTSLQPVLAIPGGNFDAYIQTISTIPLLTAAEERALVTQLFDEEDLEAARKLVLAHLRFVVYIARSYSGYGLSQADLVQEGNIGLMKAVKRFNPNMGVRLVSFAVHWIKAEMHEFILRNWRIVKIATTKAQRKLFFNLRSAKKRLGWMNENEAHLIAKDLGVPVETVKEMETRLSANDLSFDAPADEDENESFSPVYYLEDKRSNPAVQIEQNNTEEDSHEKLHQAMSRLDERSKEILKRRWLVDNKATLHDLAAEYKVSAERIRQLEQNAMKKLRFALEVA